MARNFHKVPYVFFRSEKCLQKCCQKQKGNRGISQRHGSVIGIILSIFFIATLFYGINGSR